MNTLCLYHTTFFNFSSFLCIGDLYYFHEQSRLVIRFFMRAEQSFKNLTDSVHMIKSVRLCIETYEKRVIVLLSRWPEVTKH